MKYKWLTPKVQFIYWIEAVVYLFCDLVAVLSLGFIRIERYGLIFTLWLNAKAG